MATLVLTKIFVNLVSTGAAVSAQSAPSREESFEVAGTVRTYASGRRRSVSTAGEIGTYKFTLRLTTRTDVETLRTWVGSLVQVRDHVGRRFFGTYYAVVVAEYVDLSMWDVSIALTAVTTAEGV